MTTTENPQVIREQPMEQAIAEFLSLLLPEGAERIGVEYIRDQGVPQRVRWTVYEKGWVMMSGGSGMFGADTVTEALDAFVKRPDSRMEEIARLKARLVELEGERDDS